MCGLATAVLVAALFVASPLASAPGWAPDIGHIPPGGFATITVEGVRHGDRHVSPDLHLRFRSDKERAAILVKLNGKYITEQGRLFKSVTNNPADLPQWEFVERVVIDVPLTGLAPGVHHLEIRDGLLGSSLPLVNQHDIWFSVGE